MDSNHNRAVTKFIGNDEVKETEFEIRFCGLGELGKLVMYF